MKRFLLISLLLAFVVFANCQTRNELEAEKASTVKELEQARQLLRKTQEEKTSSLKRLSLVERGIKSRRKLINTINAEINLLDNQINELEEQIKKQDNYIQKGKDEYARIVYSVYKNHTEEEKLMYLFASENLNQFYQRIKYLKYLKDYRERKIKELELLVVELESSKEELLKVRNDKEALISEKARESRDLEGERIERDNMVRRLAQDEKKIRAEIAEKERIRNEIESSIRKIIEEEARKNAGKSLYSSLTPEQKLVSNNFVQNKGRLPWPVEIGVITEEFGVNDHPVIAGLKFNSLGVKISSDPGIVARAVFDGEVKSIVAILGANYAIIIQHGEYMTVYQNVIDLKVKTGDKVYTKQPLGKVAVNENISELQFYIAKSNEYLDPELWISK